MEASVKMIEMQDRSKKYFTSKEAKRILKISDCKLAHLRVDGKLEFKKVRNRFFYLIIESENC
jgi:hypothetical protein